MRRWRATMHENGSAWYRAVNLLFSIDVKAIFIAEGLSGVIRHTTQRSTNNFWVRDNSLGI